MEKTTNNYSTFGNQINIGDIPEDTMVSVKVKEIKYSLEHLMGLCALRGFSCFVKCDAERDENIYTVMIGKYPRVDTDDPKSAIMKMLGIDK